ncbi:MAG: sigma-54 dependent transcriptional regulator [Candidatus Krumholzibacteria bacterium]|nr:sigma-54 dependent transcriptional regulator [Candidatus Krumholzibacteria bacterium]
MNPVLLVDDNRTLLEGMAEALAAENIPVSLCDTGAGALKTFKQREFALVVTDHKLPDTNGVALMNELRAQRPETVFIVITAYGTVDVAVEAMKAGAFDFVTKPFDADELVVKVKRALEQYALKEKVSRLSQETAMLRREIKGHFDDSQIVGDSPALNQVKESVEQMAGSKTAVLILGETGTGKELVARAIHYHSKRRHGPFIPVNCAMFSESLVASELFGHEKGAFTGADRRKLGRFELAHNGTIFLDEVAELPPAVQAKLLRVLQEQEFERVGGSETIKVDARVIAATNRDLEAEVRRGSFREDLYYRLNVIPLQLPALRQRREDIPRLTEHFLRRYAKENHKEIRRFTESAMNMLMRYDWPGNVRELENVVERGVVLSRGEWIEESALPFGAQTAPPGQSHKSDTLAERVEDYESQIIRGALDACGGNTTKAAERLGISRSTLRYKIEKYSL